MPAGEGDASPATGPRPGDPSGASVPVRRLSRCSSLSVVHPRAGGSEIRDRRPFMTSPQGKIYVREGDGTVTLRAEGRAVMKLCPAVNGFMQQSLAGGVKTVRLDLSR